MLIYNSRSFFIPKQSPIRQHLLRDLNKQFLKPSSGASKSHRHSFTSIELSLRKLSQFKRQKAAQYCAAKVVASNGQAELSGRGRASRCRCHRRCRRTARGRAAPCRPSSRLHCRCTLIPVVPVPLPLKTDYIDYGYHIRIYLHVLREESHKSLLRLTGEAHSSPRCIRPVIYIYGNQCWQIR